jgi:hypothetical protein
VGVNLCIVETAMAKQFLNDADICAVVQHVSSEAMMAGPNSKNLDSLGTALALNGLLIPRQVRLTVTPLWQIEIVRLTM